MPSIQGKRNFRSFRQKLTVIPITPVTAVKVHDIIKSLLAKSCIMGYVHPNEETRERVVFFLTTVCANAYWYAVGSVAVIVAYCSAS